MEETILQVQMLGQFSISRGDRQITADSVSPHAPWLLLAYLIYGRSRPAAMEELYCLLENSSPDFLDCMLHQARLLLDSLGEGLGHRCILCRPDSCQWNPEVLVLLDTDSYETLYRQEAYSDDSEARLFCGLQALALYHGDFLPQFVRDPWVKELADYFRQSFVQIALDAILFLRIHSRRTEAAELCRLALQHAPDNPELQQNLRSLTVSPGVSDGIVDDSF